jgi:bifunctional non-homologous end joining protein LigD
MKALDRGQVPEGLWQCEIKFDGFRAVAVLNGGEAELWSRNHKPLSADFPEVIQALRKLKCRDAVLDGEIVALDRAGRSRFQLLQARDLPGERPTLVYYVFDLLHRDGRSLVDEPLEARRKHLVSLAGKAAKPVQLSPVFLVEPAELLAAARQQGLEGIIAKRPGSRYEAARRSGAWLKCKVVAEQEFVIGGFTPPKNSRPYFGAILVGYYQSGKLIYAGKVGTGFDHALLRSLHATFLKRVRKACPFANLPMKKKPRFGEGMSSAAMRGVTWLKPELVAQVQFAEWTHDGLLRQPVFLGLREDKRAKQVRREATLEPPRKKSSRRSS